MKAFRIIISVLLICAFVLSFTACRKNNEDSTTTSTSATENTTYTPVETVFNEVTQTEIFTQQPTTTQAPSTEAQTTQEPTTQEPITQAPVTETPVVTTGVGKYTATYAGIEQAVFYPNSINASSEALPVVAWANGTGFSYTIYESLIKEIAEGGYIVVANKETMSADGTAQLSSLDFVISENGNPDSVLYNKVKTDKLAVAGHSQGGRSSVNAAVADSRVLCAVSLAGSNFTEEAEKLSTPTLFFAGAKDMIVGAERWVVPAFDACTGPAVYVNLKDGIHTTCSTSPEIYSGYIINWLDLWLKNDTSQRSVFQNGGALSTDTAWQDFKAKNL